MVLHTFRLGFIFLFFLAGGGVVGESATGYSFMHSAILFHLDLIYPRFWGEGGGGQQISFVKLKSRSQRRFARTGVKGTANHLCFAHLFNGYPKYKENNLTRGSSSGLTSRRNDYTELRDEYTSQG